MACICSCHGGGKASMIPCDDDSGCGHLHGGDDGDTAKRTRCGVIPGERRWACQRMTAAGLCEHCAERSGQWLSELAGLLPMLHAALAPGSAGDGPKVSGSREAPLPVRESVLSMVGPAAGRDRRLVLGDELTGLDPGDDRVGVMQHGPEPVLSVLHGWVRHIASKRRLTMPEPKPVPPVLRLPGAPFGPETRHAWLQRMEFWHRSAADTLWVRRVEAYRTFLARHHEWAAGQPWAGQYAADLHGLWQSCRNLTGSRPLRHHLPAPCPSVDCDLMTLYRDDGSDEVYCDRKQGGCGRTWSDEDYGRLVIVLASEHQGAA